MEIAGFVSPYILFKILIQLREIFDLLKMSGVFALSYWCSSVKQQHSH